MKYALVSGSSLGKRHHLCPFRLHCVPASQSHLATLFIKSALRWMRINMNGLQEGGFRLDFDRIAEVLP